MGAFLDIPTLLISAGMTSMCLSFSLVLLWRFGCRETFVLYWSVAYCLGSTAMLLVALRSHIPDALAVEFAGGALLAGFGAFWLGYRRFEGVSGRYDHLWASAGVSAWVVFALVGDLFDDMNVRALINSSIETVYLLAIIRDLVRYHRKSRMSAVGLTIGLLAFHTIKQFVWISLCLARSQDPTAIVMPQTLPMSLGFVESAIFAVSLGLLQLVLVGQRSEERLRIAAETDSLTGLANRRHFLDRILPCLVSAGERGALIVFDIDHFKRVNDTHGHPMGDVALIDFAAIMVEQAPAGSIAARIGGEEFALFLPDGTAIEAVEVAERIRRATRTLLIVTPIGELRLTVSGGVADIGSAGADYQALHSAADSALYAAKSGGRDRVEVHVRPSDVGRAVSAGTDAPAASAA